MSETLGKRMDMNKEQLKKLNQECYEIQVKVEEGGFLPSKAHPTDAGFDVFATEDIVIYPGQVKKTPLNFRMKLPEGTWAEITSKSGLGSKGLLVYAGVIDQSYRGIPHVVMSNINLIEGLDEDGLPLMRTTPIIIKKGEKLAQFIMNAYSSHYYITQVQEMDMNTSRGEGGFGSTGK